MPRAKIKSIGVIAVVAALVSLSSAASATSRSATVTPAAGDYTVSIFGGSAITLTNSGFLVFIDAIGGAQLTCTHLQAPGVANAGVHSFASVTPPSFGALDSALNTTLTSGGSSGLTGCTNPIVGASTIAPSGTWKFGVVEKTTGAATGYLDFIAMHVAAATCSFDAKGYLPGTYTNSTGNFVTAGGSGPVDGLVLSNVTGSACSLVHVANGHIARLAGTIHINLSPTIS